MKFNIKNKALIGIILVLLLFCSPNLALVSINLAYKNYYSAFVALFQGVVNCGLFLSPLIILNLRIRKYFIYISPLAVLIPPILFTIIIYHKFPTRWLFYMLFETSIPEIIEFLKGQRLWLTLIVLLPLLVVLIATLSFTHSEKLKRNAVRPFILLMCGLLVFTFLYRSMQRKSLHMAFKTTLNSYFYNTPVHTTKRFVKAIISINSSTNNYSGIPTNIDKKATNTHKNEVYILVVGESGRYKNWGINDYERNTSPHLNEIDNLISFSNIISPSFSTNKSIPIITTTATPQNLDSSNHTSILTLFKQAGFKTFWISTQTSQGNVVGTIANQADKTVFLNDGMNLKYDIELIPVLKGILKKNDDNLFIILHTNGSHYPYQNRYPDSLAKFTPSLTKNRHLALKERHKEEIINSYDNSIAYTDYFLSEVMQTIDKEYSKALFMYISDHGENLFDQSNAGFGRGYGKLSKELFHVPFFIWASEDYINSNELWNQLISNKDVKASTTAISNTLTNLAGIHWLEFDSTNCFSHEAFNVSERFLINKSGVIDYDVRFENK